MDVNAITQLVGSVGFPIAACICLFYMYNKQITVINDLKVVLTKLINKLDVDVDVDEH